MGGDTVQICILPHKQEWVHYTIFFATNTYRTTTWKTPSLVSVLTI